MACRARVDLERDYHQNQRGLCNALFSNYFEDLFSKQLTCSVVGRVPQLSWAISLILSLLVVQIPSLCYNFGVVDNVLCMLCLVYLSEALRPTW